MRIASSLMLGAVLATATFAAAAHADEPAASALKAGVITTDTIHIKLRPPRPQVVSEISKIAAQRPLSELRQPFLDRVEKAIDKAPF